MPTDNDMVRVYAIAPEESRGLFDKYDFVEYNTF